MNALWERPEFRAIMRETNDGWRPGGLELTRQALSWCEERALIRPACLAVDCGAGPGISLELLAQRGYRALGLDRQFALHSSAAKAQGITLLQADILHLPLVDACAGLVLFECVLSLLANPLTALDAANRILQPAGICLVSDLIFQEKSAAPQAAFFQTQKLSCTHGAKRVGSWLELFHQAGFRPLFSQDASQSLKELAARLVWYGGKKALCSCGITAPGRYGYQFWILQKEENHEPDADGTSAPGSPGL